MTTIKYAPNGSGNPEDKETALTLQRFISNYLKFGKNYEEFEKHLSYLRSNPKTEKIVENIITDNIRKLKAEDFENITKDGPILMTYSLIFVMHGSKYGIKDLLDLALQIFKKCRNYFEKNTLDYANTLANEGFTRRRLAGLGVDSVENLREAIKLYQRAREEGFTENTSNYAGTLMNEGIARRRLAGLGVDSVENLTEAIKLYQRAREEGFIKNTPRYAGALANEGDAKMDLAGLGVDSVENLTEAIKLYGRAREEGFIKNTPRYAGALANEGDAKMD
ncbi:MAG: hypothetical protein Q6356_002065, partial [Candidatus Wukongarchaeota archaeon]|nr:hypothetical protein [Candidatus Wukongarchaeota archaeon]